MILKMGIAIGLILHRGLPPTGLAHYLSRLYCGSHLNESLQWNFKQGQIILHYTTTHGQLHNMQNLIMSQFYVKDYTKRLH